jgi:hypothetical protein
MNLTYIKTLTIFLICKQTTKTQLSQFCNSIHYHFNLCKKDLHKIKKVSLKRKIQRCQLHHRDSRKSKQLTNQLEQTSKYKIEKARHRYLHKDNSR